MTHNPIQQTIYCYCEECKSKVAKYMKKFSIDNFAQQEDLGIEFKKVLEDNK